VRELAAATRSRLRQGFGGIGIGASPAFPPRRRTGPSPRDRRDGIPGRFLL